MRTSWIVAVWLASAVAHAATPLVVYDDALRNGFNDRSWEGTPAGSENLAATSPVYGSSGHSIQFVARTWNGLQLVADGSEFNLADYQSVSFQVNGGTAGGQKLQMYVCDNYTSLLANSVPVETLVAGGAIPKNAWATATLDFDAAGLTFGTFNCLVIMDANGGADTVAGQSPVYIDQIVFNPRTSGAPAGGSVSVSVDVTANVRPINPLIFGVAFGDAARNQQMGYTVDRWGGNSTSRYNWRGPAHNTGNDYFFLGYGSDQTDNADTFVASALSAGIQPLIAVPTIGMVEKFNAANPTDVVWGYSQAKYGPQTLDECRFYGANPPSWCHGDAGNGQCDATVNKTGHCVNGQIVGNDPADTSIANTSADDAAWIAHLQTAHGTAANGGVKFYSLDNEVMLWNSTHRDVHPTAPTYDEIWSKTVDYATAIKQQEPNALVTGPVTWGYCDLFGSAADNCVSGGDRQAHGGTPFVAWYLQQVCSYQTQHGIRLVDYLDLHYYPQDPGGTPSIYSNSDDASTAGRRLRSLKELYDASWPSESWIGTLGDDPTWHYSKPDLIPRVKAWINQYCPGTKLAITEYAWDQDQTTSGAVAQAEALAIFAREGVDLATRWTAPASGSKAERAFQIFLNYDGAGGKVSGDSVGATSSNIDQVGAYAFHLAGQRTMVLLTNKDTVTHDVALTFNAAHNANWTLYGYTGTTNLAQTNTGAISGTSLTLSALPAMSASLLVIPEVDEIFKDGFGEP